MCIPNVSATPAGSKEKIVTDVLSEQNIKNFAAAWYNALDIHAPVENCLEFLADDVEMNFPPDPPFTGYEGFRKWYVDIIIKTFFDESHNVVSVDIANATDDASRTKHCRSVAGELVQRDGPHARCEIASHFHVCLSKMGDSPHRKEGRVQQLRFGNHVLQRRCETV